MIRALFALLGAAIAGFRGPAYLAVENAALRQQLAVFKHKRPRPSLSAGDRLFWVLLHRVWPNWRNALVIVQADTVVRWHRQGFRIFWAWKSRRRSPGRPRVDLEIRQLIRRMANDNGWGGPRIHGEVQKLGFDVSERTVSRYAEFEFSKGWWDYIEAVRRFGEWVNARDIEVVGQYVIDTPPPCEQLPMPAVVLRGDRFDIGLRWDFGRNPPTRDDREWAVSIRRDSPYVGPLFGLIVPTEDLVPRAFRACRRRGSLAPVATTRPASRRAYSPNGTWLPCCASPRTRSDRASAPSLRLAWGGIGGIGIYPIFLFTPIVRYSKPSALPP